MNKLILILIIFCAAIQANAADKYDNPDTLFVACDGKAGFNNISDAIEVCRAFMDYHKVIFVKNGVYKEKLVIPSWLTNIEICGQDRDKTIITYDDHANIKLSSTGKPMGTFRTFTLKVAGSDITIKNITIENNAPRLGQAVALHTEGTRLVFVNCKFLGNQDTVFTGVAGTQLYFKRCYIEGTTDFIFGPATTWFESCTIKSKANSYATAASTPYNQLYGYVFNKCELIADNGVDSAYLGRPWRPYACVIFMNCNLGKHILPAGWTTWQGTNYNETARYFEYNNTGDGANTSARVIWSCQLTKEQAETITLNSMFGNDIRWIPMR